MEQNVDRETLQDAIFDQLIIPEDQYSYIYKQFWINPSNKNSLRLTKRGYVLLSKTLGLTYYVNTFRDPVNTTHALNLTQGMVLLQLDRTMTCPYYISDFNRLDLFGEKEQMWLAMYDGDLLKFLASWK